MSTIKDKCIGNLLNYWGKIATTSNGVILNYQSSLMVLSQLPESIFNALFKVDLSKCSFKQIVSEINKHTNHLPFSVWIESPNLKSEITHFFESEKFNYFGWLPVMVIGTDISFNKSLPENIDIVQHEASTDLTAWMGVFSNVFMFDHHVSHTLQTIFEKMARHLIHFSAMIDGKVVGTASLFMDDEMAGFYNLGVLPSYRNKGIASALHNARLKTAKEMGFSYATLQATPMAIELDKSIGFTPVTGFHIYSYNNEHSFLSCG
jgi:GNAT superfamily N-acetyltransferase